MIMIDGPDEPEMGVLNLVEEHGFLGESEPTSLRLKKSKSTKSLPSDNLAGRLSTPSGVAFANRYDFSASLGAAIQAQRSPNSSPREEIRAQQVFDTKAAYMSGRGFDIPRANISLDNETSTSAGFIGRQPSNPSNPSNRSAMPGLRIDNANFDTPYHTLRGTSRDSIYLRRLSKNATGVRCLNYTTISKIALQTNNYADPLHSHT
ncbi:hypothetical protein F4679DRAFT_87474 [Xylaria curta]|nr:hypothetical protein F4679DRAFT_87474 [Xylaria curta]